MAITVQSSPAPYSSMHDDLWFVSSSTNVSQITFKFVYDIYISGALVNRVKVFPNPSAEGSYGIYNASPVVRAYSTNYFEPSGSSILVASNDKIKVDYTYNVGEEYINASGTTVTNYGLASGALSAYNFYQPLFDDILLAEANTPLSLTSYYNNLLITNFTDNWLTERDNDNISLQFGDNFYATYLKITAGSYSFFTDVVNESGTVIDTASASITLAGQMNLFNLSAASINTWAGRTLISSSTYGYKCYLKLGVAITRKLSFTQKSYCKFRQYNLNFLNRLGGWDTMNFALANKRSSKFDRTTYRKASYKLTGTAMSSIDTFNRYNESTTNYAIQHINSYHLTSDWVTEQDYDWLSQLVASPIVYMEVQGAYFPVTITNSNYDYKLVASDGLFNFEIDVEVGKYTNSQFR